MFVTNLPKADPTYFCLAKVSVIFDRWTNLENVIKYYDTSICYVMNISIIRQRMA